MSPPLTAAAAWSAVRSLIRRHGLRERVRAWSHRTDASPPASYEELRARVRAYHPHSFIMMSPPPTTTRRARPSPTAAATAADLERDVRRPPDYAYDAATRVGRITLYTFAHVGVTDAQFSSRCGALAADLRRHVDAWLSTGMRGILLDFRAHHGGSVWPLIYGFARLLDGVPLFAWTTPEAARPRWGVVTHAAAVATRSPCRAGFARMSRRPPPRDLPLAVPDLKVAVVVGPTTASSGELGAAMFAGKAGVRVFGRPTSGFMSVNNSYRVGPGVELVLTELLAALTDGRPLTERLDPDVVTARPIAAATAWLRGPRRSVGVDAPVTMMRR